MPGGARTVRLVLVAALTLLAAGPAQGEAGVFDLAADAPVELAADVEVVLRGAGGTARYLASGEAVGELRGVTGTLTLYEYDAVTARAPWGPAVIAPTGSRERVFELDDATVRFEQRYEPATLVVVADAGGEVAVTGAAEGRGRPEVVPRRIQDSTAGATGAVDPYAAWTWEAGWSFLGEYPLAALAGFPALPDATLGLRGPVQLLLNGGNLTFTDAAGQTHRVALGPRAAEHAPDAAPYARGEVRARALLDATVAEAAVPLPAHWAFAAPTARWVVDGEAVWRAATGTLRLGDAEVAFDEATLAAAGRFAVEVRPDDAAAGSRSDGFVGFGDFDELRVDGAAVEPPASPAAAVGLGALALAAFAAAGWAAAAFYTRIPHDDLLQHPVRRALHEAAVRHPGRPKRELARTVGVGWGAFTFHLRLLVRSGYLRLEPQGRYTLVYPAGSTGSAPPPIPHPLARRVYETLPADGTPLAFHALRDRLGISRQLLAYHLRGLEARGLVRPVAAAGERAVARAAGGRPPA